MTMLQEQAVRMIQDMSDDNVGFLLEVIDVYKRQPGTKNSYHPYANP